MHSVSLLYIFKIMRKNTRTKPKQEQYVLKSNKVSKYSDSKYTCQVCNTEDGETLTDHDFYCPGCKKCTKGHHEEGVLYAE